MSGKLVLFSAPHIAVLASVPFLSMTLARLARSSASAERVVRLSLGVFLTANELTWWVWRVRTEGFRFPEAIPLQLCDLILWCTVIACLRRSQWAFEVAYYLSLSAGVLTLLTPDLWADCWTYPTLYFFAAHGGVLVTTLALALSGAMRPQPGSIRRALIAANGWALLAGTFNLAFGTNYMYLCQKPSDATILDLLGPWPWYVLSGEAIAVSAFWLLWLPFRWRVRYDTVAGSTASDAVK